MPFSLACLILASSWAFGDKSSLAEKKQSERPDLPRAVNGVETNSL